MVNVLLVSDEIQKIETIEKVLSFQEVKLVVKSQEEEIKYEIMSNIYDIIILDNNIQNVDIHSIVRKIKVENKTQNSQIILITDSDTQINKELMMMVSGFIQFPFSDDMFIATINSHIRTKHSLDILAQNNTELAKSLYQLDVLYKTSTQLAGSLDKENLISSMIEGVDKTLSFDVSYTLIFDDKNNIKLFINSLYPLTSTLEEAIKLRAILNYRGLNTKKSKNISLSAENIKVIKNIKLQQYKEFDLTIFRFDSLLSEIKSGDKFVGLMEVFRQKEFATDDATCFQTLSKQVAIPLESASLYEELKETNIKLEKLERLKSEFISIVSHELRTPLTALKNSLDIILTGKTGEITGTMEKFLNMAKRNSVRLSGIINDLLDLSKVEAGRMEFRYALHNINSSIEYVKNALDNLAKEKNIKININSKDEIPQLYIDPQRIEQVLTNLVSNAIKFTPEQGEINITTNIISENELREKNLVEQTKRYINGDYVQISVKDTGIGISENDIVKVFDKFQQIENSLTRKIGGTGLGIPIAKQLVEAHRGFIWVESKLNEGSTFSIAIPVANERNKFNIDFMNSISKAKIAHSDVGYIEIRENQNSNIHLVDKILNNEIDIIKKTENTQEIKLINDEKIIYNAFIPEADEYVLNFIYKKLRTYLQSLNNNEKMFNITYSQVLYPRDGLDTEELKLNAKKRLSKVD